jgi:hypothetical protein
MAIYEIISTSVNIGHFTMRNSNPRVSNPEPKLNLQVSQIDLIQALSWYSQNKETKDSHKYAVDYLKKKYKLDVSSVIKTRSSTFGFVCRLLSNGAELPQKNQMWFQAEIQKMKDELAIEVVDVPVEKTNVVSIQDRIKEKSKECIGELEGLIDELMISEYSANVSPLGVMTTMGVKDAYTKYIIEHFKTRRNEFDEILYSKDDDIKEAYSNFTKPNLKKMIAYCDQVIIDCGKLSQTAVKTRKPRKRKVKTATQITAKVNYCKEFKELKLVSIMPDQIVGVMQLWVYNTKTRKLGVYHADDAGGLSVKGSSIINFSESKSVQKTLRKPAEMLPEVLGCGKVALRSILPNIRAAEGALTGRLNKDTILLRIIK